jgi:hypothetical protein
MIAGLNRYWMLAEPVVEVKPCSNRLVDRNRQLVCVGGAPLKGQSAVGAGGSVRLAGATLKRMPWMPLV